ncbi:hypothetical protein [Nocardioides sp. WS12]|uniref:hypothetical protein n=1 Tax=Nocardioides sp. WS12 TaxID=2486272 RepID=UPI0015FB50DC|nr:hypothetical protein [Nocardioides sp. WS12]
MSRRGWAVLATITALFGLVASTTSPAAADDTTEPFAVSDAVFRWGINDESNNNAFAPGTYNFLSAGIAPDPGTGGQVISNDAKWPSTGATAWRGQSGSVRIEKVTSSGPQLATFAGLKTGPDGQSLGGPTVPIFSNHQAVLSGGAGQVDPEAGTATIRWTGSFTVFYYSGMSFFTVTDPTLEVTPTSARITATGSGYSSSMDDESVWQPVAPTTITLAELETVDETDLAAENGFSAATKYLGVRYDAPAAGTTQVRTGEHWGAFPGSMLGFLEKVGMTSYWYSSGGSNDRFKVPHPVTVSWDAKTAIVPETPVTPVLPQLPVNPAGEAPPTIIRVPSAPVVVQRPTPALPTPVAPPVPAPAQVTPASYSPPVVYALTSSPTSSTDRPAGSNHAWEWSLGFLLLLGAAGITVFTPRMTRLKGTR